MVNEGYIKLYRKALDNPIICKDSDYFSVWIYLLLSATHDEYDVFFKNNRITLNAGQLITGRKTIAEKFNIDESKVQRILKYFEKQHQIEQQTSTKNRLISIVNWNEYQTSRHQIEQQVNNKRTTSEQQVNTNKNVKNVKNERNNNKVNPTLDEIESYIQEKSLNVSAKQFYDYFTEGNWIDSNGNKVKNWKQKLLTWDRYGINEKNIKKQTNYNNYEQRTYDNLEKLYANGR